MEVEPLYQGIVDAAFGFGHCDSPNCSRTDGGTRALGDCGRTVAGTSAARVGLSSIGGAEHELIQRYRPTPLCNRPASARLLLLLAHRWQRPMAIEQTDITRREWKTPELRSMLCRGLRPCDRPLDPEREPPLGAHMVTPRRGYTHHGIYVGGGRVVQYGGLSWGLRRGPVEEVPLAEFAHGRPVWIRLVRSPWFDPHEVVRRARLRLGEDRYSLLTNNCEHFCEWCVRGEHRSYQVDERSTGYRAILLRLIELLARMRLPQQGSAAADYHAICVSDPYQRATD
jgi:hypothetical protein